MAWLFLFIGFKESLTKDHLSRITHQDSLTKESLTKDGWCEGHYAAGEAKERKSSDDLDQLADIFNQLKVHTGIHNLDLLVSALCKRSDPNNADDLLAGPGPRPPHTSRTPLLSSPPEPFCRVAVLSRRRSVAETTTNSSPNSSRETAQNSD